MVTPVQQDLDVVQRRLDQQAVQLLVGKLQGVTERDKCGGCVECIEMSADTAARPLSQCTTLFTLSQRET